MDRNTWIGLTAAALCLAFVFLTQDGGGSPTDTLEKDTMHIHDEAMKQMADMNRLGRALKHELENLDSLSARGQAIQQALAQMKNAEEGMYGWMNQYTPPVKMPPAEAEKYLTAQKQLIEKNYQDMLNATEAGKKLLPQ